MPSEFQFKETPLALGIPKSCPLWCMDIFWNCPILEFINNNNNNNLYFMPLTFCSQL